MRVRARRFTRRGHDGSSLAMRLRLDIETSLGKSLPGVLSVMRRSGHFRPIRNLTAGVSKARSAAPPRVQIEGQVRTLCRLPQLSRCVTQLSREPSFTKPAAGTLRLVKGTTRKIPMGDYTRELSLCIERTSLRVQPRNSGIAHGATANDAVSENSLPPRRPRSRSSE